MRCECPGGLMPKAVRTRVRETANTADERVRALEELLWGLEARIRPPEPDL